MTRRTSSPVQSLEDSLRRLSRQTAHLRSLRFPNFRNFIPGAVINFEFPITVVLGKNGTNKSSLLHALYGAPKNNSISEFWFETDLDAIPKQNEKGLKQSVVHSYLSENEKVECIKSRAPRKSDPDYWEAVKPTEPYGFPPGQKIRVTPLEIEVMYMDFRGQLPAFDRYFYYPDERHLERLKSYSPRRRSLRRGYRKQDYLRSRTHPLKKLLESKAVSFSDKEIQVLRYVLERDYHSGIILEHALFHGHRGHTIVFKTPNFGQGYSEAFAGSGESAAAMLVHNIERVPEKSLVLLDEPETSLHPGAQQRILEFLADRASRKELQIVLASHSIYFTGGLPQEAIRVLRLDPAGKVVVDESTSAREALHEIATVTPGATIMVEDERARKIVLTELKAQNPHAGDEFEVRVRPGGTSRIYQDIKAYVNAARKDIFVIFDGDHEWKKPIPCSGNLPQGFKELKTLISELTKGNNDAGPELYFVDINEATAYVEFLRKYVRFLPKRTPEELVWSDDIAKKLIDPIPEEIIREGNFKNKISLLPSHVRILLNENEAFSILLYEFFKTDSEDRKKLTSIIEYVRRHTSSEANRQLVLG